MNTVTDYERELDKSRDEIIHLISAYDFARGSRIAYCGFDTTGRPLLEENEANCVVCIQMSIDSQRARDEWLESIAPDGPGSVRYRR